MDFNYKFNTQTIEGITYRLPKLNFNSKPFNGDKFND